MNIAPLFGPIPLLVLICTMPELMLIWLVGALAYWIISSIVFNLKLRMTGTVRLHGVLFKVKYNPLPFEKEVKMLITKLRKT